MTPMTGRAPAFALLLSCVAAACRTSPPGPARPAITRPAPRVASNILRADYAGSARCAGCHAEITAAWHSSPMHLMTRLPEAAQVRAPFDGRIFRFKDDTARLTQEGGARFVALDTAAGAEHHLYRVTRVIGGRYREDFAGVEVDPGGAPRSGPELLLPISYVFETRSFRLKGYSVLVGERPGLRAGGVWSQTCIFCHNTVPYFDDIWGALHGPGAPSYQGEVVDRLLPENRRLNLSVAAGQGDALVAAVGAELRAVGSLAPLPAEPQGALRRGLRELRAHFTARDFVEIGIGCEACHGGSRAHADDPNLLPDFAPRAAFLEAGAPREVTRAERINRVCARCHQVLFSRYPFTWEGGQRHGADAGGSSITSGEARDFLLGGCARQMSCVACHDPHGQDRPADLRRLETPAGNGVCLRCHGQYAAPEALRAHAHHDPGGAGASCVACHMPRKNMGLGYALTRYHRIGRPDDPVRVERDRPIECALCHADKTVGQLAGTMEQWWGRRYDRAMLQVLYGSLDARPLQATLTRGKPHEQAVAIATLEAAHQTDAVAPIARQLVNPFPLVRYYARRALAALRGADCAVDLDRPVPEIAAAVRACVPDAFAAEPAPAGRSAAGPDVPDED